MDATGAPIAGARVAAANGSAERYSGPDGTFRLTGGTDVAEVVVSAPGFANQTLASMGLGKSQLRSMRR